MVRSELYEDDYVFNEQEFKGKLPFQFVTSLELRAFFGGRVGKKMMSRNPQAMLLPSPPLHITPHQNKTKKQANTSPPPKK